MQNNERGMPQEQSDEALMMLVAQGNRRAFDQLVRRHLAVACALAARIGSNPGDAEDIAQEAFTKVWVSAPNWREGKARFRTWLHRIVVNAAIDRYRRKGRGRETGMSEERWSAVPEPGTLQDENLMHKRENEMVTAAIYRLPEKQRVAILLCYQDEMTNRQAAEIMGIHIKSLEALLGRARQSLRAELKELGDAHG